MSCCVPCLGVLSAITERIQETLSNRCASGSRSKYIEFLICWLFFLGQLAEVAKALVL